MFGFRLLKQGLAVRLVLFALSFVILLAILVASLPQYLRSDGLVLPNGRAVTGDFVSFYAAGQLLREAPDALYDYVRQREQQSRIFSGSGIDPGILPFIYPPLVALMFSWFAPLKLVAAFAAWGAVSVALYVTGVILVLRRSALTRADTLNAFVFSLAFFPFSMETVMAGQTGALGVFILTAVYCLLRANREFAAGLALGLGYYKPPLFLVLALIFAVQRKFRVVAGAALSGGLLVVGGILLIGWSAFLRYVELASSYRYGSAVFGDKGLPRAKAVGLYSVLVDVAGQWGAKGIGIALFLGSVAMTLIWFARQKALLDSAAKHEGRFDLGFALAAGLSVFLSLQMAVYDLSLFIVPVLLVASTVSRVPRWVGALSVCAAVGLLIGFMFPPLTVGSVVIKPYTVIAMLWLAATAVSLGTVEVPASGLPGNVSHD